ncbi:DUF2007 domain-containing protein [Hyunsoonleella flava]|uniref:DUF2007 domain-containing protein n=1 Tax=Hyunsoonleella flava TaxID=2527939 RepID=A0A4V2JA42_9FLAO|nr:DUF2007 domain-containing protein [Hyunsoonleella flava]TBN03923.1 DUF2007 domain-containing protein [Hyunsoonleella flava]
MLQTFTTVAKFQYSSEAQIIKGRLESEGIQVFLRDNFTIDTDPLVSNAIGGVKLKVLSHQVEEAKEILNAINEYSINGEGNNINCPNCNSEKVKVYSTIRDGKSFLAFIFALLINLFVSILPFYTKYKYKCENCSTEFKIEKP